MASERRPGLKENIVEMQSCLSLYVTAAGGRTWLAGRAVAFVLMVACLACIGLVAAADRADGAFGDGYGLVPINSGPGTLDVPAVPAPAQRFFWAGVCDRRGAPAAGSDLGALGGIGTMPSTSTAPNTLGSAAQIVDVPLVGSVPNCIDWRLGVTAGGQAGTSPSNIWTPPPNWRLPAATRAGSHPDGSATFAFLNPMAIPTTSMSISRRGLSATRTRCPSAPRSSSL